MSPLPRVNKGTFFSNQLRNGFCLYQINFPPDGFISPTNIPQLEQLLPPREEVILPEEGEEVDLEKIDRDEQERSRRQHMVRTESHLDLSAFKIVGTMLKLKAEAGLVKDKQLSNVCKIFIARLESRNICSVSLLYSESG